MNILCVFLVLVLQAGARLVRLRGSAASHPVEDVISLLQRLSTQVEEEGKAEALLFEKFQHWCARSEKTVNEAIAQGESKLESLEDVMEGKSTTVSVLDKEIDALGVQIQEIDQAQSESDTARANAASLYDTEKNSLELTIDAVGHCIGNLTSARQTTDTSLLQSSVTSFLDVAGARVSLAQRDSLERAAAENSTDRPVLKAAGDYNKHIDVYDFKSDSVVEMLKSLEQKFEAELLEKNKGETNAINAYNLAKEASSDLRAAAVKLKGAKDVARADAARDLLTANTTHQSTAADLKADKNTLSVTQKSCELKAVEWSERSKVREGEMEAMAAAEAIMAKVAGVRTTAPANPLPPTSPVFLQLDNPEVQKALKLLRDEASVSHSQAISQLVSALVARKEGPFDQVINSIEKMIVRLQHEQTEEDNHKHWCDQELNKTNSAVMDKTAKINDLTSKIDVASARVNSLTNEIKDANAMVTTIDTHMREATEIRNTGKQENSLAIKDAKAAQAALAQAVAVIREFYKKTGQVPKQSWEFLQQGGVNLPANPSTWSAAYVGVSDPMANANGSGEGIIAMLERISADFSTMHSNTVSQEESDQTAYEDDMKACKIEKARRVKESEMKSQEKKRLISKHDSMSALRKTVKNERNATETYLDDLQPACVTGDGVYTYAERVAARDKEITALKDAKKHLQNAFN